MTKNIWRRHVYPAILLCVFLFASSRVGFDFYTIAIPTLGIALWAVQNRYRQNGYALAASIILFLALLLLGISFAARYANHMLLG
jgi:hypothetical protein